MAESTIKMKVSKSLSIHRIGSMALLILLASVLLVGTAAADDDVNETATVTATATEIPESKISMTLTPGDAWGDYLELEYSGSISGGTADSWEWDFGDESGTSSSQSGTYTYDEPGSYTVSLTVISSDSDIDDDQLTQIISIEEPDFEALADITQTSGSLTITYESTTDGAEEWEWDFGDDDGTDDDESGTYTYDEPGDYTVTLTATSEEGTTDTYSEEISFDTGPSAYFTVDNETGASPLYVEFYDGSEENPYTGADIVEWEWDFDYDDEEETFDDDDSSADTEFTFEDEGTYTVTLTVTDEDGEEDTYELDIVVDDDAAPTADYSIDDDCDTTGSAPLTIQFYDESDEADDTDSEITSWLWKFYDEDGDLYLYSYAENPELEFEDAGVYTLVLTVRDEDGMSDTITEEDLVEVTSGLSVTFYAPTTSGTAPLTVTFNARDGSYNEYDIETYYWSFGDGSTDSETDTSVSHTYTSAGTYDVKLKVTDEEGNTYTYTKEDYITVSQAATVTAKATTYAVETDSATTVAATETVAVTESTSSGTKIFGLPGTEFFRSEAGRFYNLYEEYLSLLSGIFGMG